MSWNSGQKAAWRELSTGSEPHPPVSLSFGLRLDSGRLVVLGVLGASHAKCRAHEHGAPTAPAAGLVPRHQEDTPAHGGRCLGVFASLHFAARDGDRLTQGRPCLQAKLSFSHSYPESPLALESDRQTDKPCFARRTWLTSAVLGQ